MDIVSTIATQKKKKVQAQYLVEDNFSTYVYTGTSATQDIVNGIDLATDGGMVMVKAREAAVQTAVFDTERGATEYLLTTATNASTIAADSLTAFNTDGFSLGVDTSNWFVNNSGAGDYVSWTFKKSPRFFDVVKYTGDGVAGREIAHSLGVVPGMFIVKNTSNGGAWYVNHRSLSANGRLELQDTRAEDIDTDYWDNTRPTDTHITLAGSFDYGGLNTLNHTYVVYLFAHDPLGASGDGSDGMIACGSYVGNWVTLPEIDIGWEPQFLLIKSATDVQEWYIFDTIRGLVVGGADSYLRANSSAAEVAVDRLALTPTGFNLTSTGSDINNDAQTYIYMAIRRPMGIPQSASEVFAVDAASSTDPSFVAGFPIDMAFFRKKDAVSNTFLGSRLTQARALETNNTNAESAMAGFEFDFMDSYYTGSGFYDSTYVSSMWKRAKGFFDVVAYTGTGVARTVDHNLGVVPEMMWIKRRSTVGSWIVYHKDIGNTSACYLNTTDIPVATIGYFNNTTPTDTSFTVGVNNDVNASAATIITYLFTTLAGISKVGSYTGNGTTQTIDCGFSAGARFILIKRTDAAGDWCIWDSVRGIEAGNDPHLFLNTTAAEVLADSVDPESTGFIVNQIADTNVNVNTAEYIFYAIA